MRRSSLLSVFFFLGLLCGAFAQSLSNFFGSDDAQALTQSLTSFQKKDGSFLGLKNTFQGVASFQILKATVPQKEKICEFASGSSVVDAESAHYIAGISETLSCGKDASDQVKTILKNGLKSDSLETVYHAVSAISYLTKGKHVKISDDDLTAAFTTVLDLVEEDGTARENPNDEEGSIYHGALAVSTLSQLASLLKLKDEQKTKLVKVLTDASSVEGVAGAAGTIEFKDDESGANSIKVTALFFAGLNDLAKAVDKKPKDVQITEIAEFFIQNKRPSTLEDAYHVLLGIQTAANNVISKPLVVTLAKNSLSSTSKADAFVKVRLTDIYGNFASKAKVVLTEAVSAASNKQVVVNQEIFLADEKEKTVYQFNFLVNKPEPGLYSLSFRVTPEDKSFLPIDSATKPLKVVGSASISDIRLFIADSDDVHALSDASSYTVPYPQPLKDKISATGANHLFVQFKLTSGNKAISVHQAFIRVSTPQTSVTTVAEKKGGKYEAHLSFASAASEFRAKNGTYDVEVIIGDAFIDNSFTSKLASIDLKYSPDMAVPEAELSWKPKKEIHWQQRQAEPRPPKTTSLAFTLLIGAPIAILLIGLIALGANISNFPTSGLEFLYAVGFQGGLGSILFLFAVYWLRLNMVQTLGYFLILALPTFFFGVKTLNHLSKAYKTKKD